MVIGEHVIFLQAVLLYIDLPECFFCLTIDDAAAAGGPGTFWQAASEPVAYALSRKKSGPQGIAPSGSDGPFSFWRPKRSGMRSAASFSTPLLLPSTSTTCPNRRE
jgi:hypothetical protein